MSNCLAQSIAATYAGQSYTLWSVRLSLIFYVISLSVLLLDFRKLHWKTNRCLWSIGCSLFVVHVVCAFQFVHGWSHQQAIAETAKQTFEVVGVDWGGGLFFNYAFALLWIMDAGWWWISPRTYNQRASLCDVLIHVFFAFIAFNATVIFELGPTRLFGILATIWLLAIAAYSIRRNLKLDKKFIKPPDIF